MADLPHELALLRDASSAYLGIIRDTAAVVEGMVKDPLRPVGSDDWPEVLLSELVAAQDTSIEGTPSSIVDTINKLLTG